MRSAARAALRLCLALLLTTARPAGAHNQPYSFVDLRLEPDHLAGTVMVHVVDLAHEIGLANPDSLLFPGVAERYADQARRLLEDRLQIQADGELLRPAWSSPVLVPQRSGVAFAWTSSWRRLPAQLRISARPFPYDPQHLVYFNIYQQGELRYEDVLDQNSATIVYMTGEKQSAMAVLGRFVPAGIHHIFIGPDHLLFIIGLLLLGGGLRRLLKIVTAFTIAHSITLALATFRIVEPPARVIEPMIAASIILVGIENLTAGRRGHDRRALLAFAFGFIHGFGFANVLRELDLPTGALGWSLLGFNTGVEIGQAAIVLTVAPLLALIRSRRPRIATRILAYGSGFVIVAGGFWLIQRTFFS